MNEAGSFLSRLLTNPHQLFLTAVAIYLGIQGINIVLNSLGIDLGPATTLLDGVINLGYGVVGILFILSLIVFLANRNRGS